METILIVDDEKNYLTILSAVLEEEGFEVLTALSGQEALEIYKTSDLDLVVTDMKMPEMDGIALLENIKQLDPDLPVMMMTAHGTIDKAVEAMQKGAYNYILKPFDNERLVLYVNKAVSMYRVVKENRQLSLQRRPAVNKDVDQIFTASKAHCHRNHGDCNGCPMRLK